MFRWHLFVSALVGLGGMCGTVQAQAPRAESPIADGYRLRWVDQRIRAIRPTMADKRFESVGWVSTLAQARALANQHGRPLFLFTHSGHLNQGRC